MRAMVIYYDARNFVGSLVSYTGTVWPLILTRVLCMAIYILLCYALEVYESRVVGSEGRTVLLATTSFLLIFRANQAYARYYHGRTTVSQFFSDLREFMMLCMILPKGGIANASIGLEKAQRTNREHENLEDAFDKQARELKVDIARLSVAMAVCFKLHTRICLDGYHFGAISKDTKWRVDWDRLRLRQLLVDEEFEAVEECLRLDEGPHAGQSAKGVYQRLLLQFEGPDGKEGPQEPPDSWPEFFSVDCQSATRCPVALAFFLRERIFMHMNEGMNTQPWGIKERFIVELIDLIMKLLLSYEDVTQIITTPIPLPLAALCKTLVFVFMASMPAFLNYHETLFSNTVLPVTVTVAMLGIDAISTEIENPFGDDTNDLDVLEVIHMLENEAMELLMLAGDHEGRERFVWRRLPPFMRKASPRKIMRQLAVKAFAAPEVAECNSEDSVLTDESSEELGRSHGSHLFGSDPEMESLL